MSWLSLTVNADAAYAESLSEALLEFGALSVDMHDADADTPQEQPSSASRANPPPACGRTTASRTVPGRCGQWKTSCCRRHCQRDCSSHHRTTSPAAGQRLGAPYTIAVRPIRISQRLWIVLPGIRRLIPTPSTSCSTPALPSAPQPSHHTPVPALAG